LHIPDNYLSPTTCAVMGAAMIPVWSVAIKKVKDEITKVKMPLLGIGASFSFLMMMFNIPLPGGTTGHAVGGTLLAILLGPFSACISVSIALLIQALFFGDGGILAFGANCFNMAFVLPFLGYFIYKFIKDRVKTEKGEYVGIIAGSYLGINFVGFGCGYRIWYPTAAFYQRCGATSLLSISIGGVNTGHDDSSSPGRRRYGSNLHSCYFCLY